MLSSDISRPVNRVCVFGLVKNKLYDIPEIKITPEHTSSSINKPTKFDSAIKKKKKISFHILFFTHHSRETTLLGGL